MHIHIVILKFQHLKKIISIFLAAAFIFNIMGYYVVYQIIVVKVRNQVRTEISRGHSGRIQNILLNSGEFSKIRWFDDDEFLYKGSMYDKVSITCEGKNILIKCYHDSKEENLYSGLKKIDQWDKKYISGLTGQIIQTAIPGNILVLNYPDLLVRKQSHFLKSYFEDHSCKVNTPPPEVI